MANYLNDTIILRYKTEKRYFFERNMIFKKFKYIDEERMEEIRNDALNWSKKNSNNSCLLRSLSIFLIFKNNNINRNIRKEINILDYSSSDEELMFYMFAIDPELKLLQFYYSENKIQEVKKKFFEEFKIEFDSRLLKIELMYNTRFPTIIDEFSEPKKLKK